MSREEFGNQQVGFGKWAHILIKDLARTDRDYAEWLVGTLVIGETPIPVEMAYALSDDHKHEVAKYCVGELPVAFGKYLDSPLPIKELVSTDREFAEWLVGKLDRNELNFPRARLVARYCERQLAEERVRAEGERTARQAAWNTDPSGQLYQCPDCESWTTKRYICDNDECSSNASDKTAEAYSQCDDCGCRIVVQVNKDGDVIESGMSEIDAYSGELISLDTLCDRCAEARICSGGYPDRDVDDANYCRESSCDEEDDDDTW